MLYFTEDTTCSGSVVANAAARAFESDTHQPFVGCVHICANDVNITNTNFFKAVLLHEITHALGFSSQLFEYMLDSNGNKYTQPIKSVTVAGKQFSALTTPKVTDFVKSHYNCSTLQGAYLENSGSSTGTAGSHWELTTFKGELMTGYISSVEINRLSRLTLSWFEDTGYYEVDYSAAETLPFGEGQGCNMANMNCADNSGNPIGDYCIVSKPVKSICSPDLTGTGYCDSIDQAECPIPRMYSNGNCKYVSSREDLGNYGGEGSYCHVTNGLINKDYTSTNIPASGCFKTECYEDHYNLLVCVKNPCTRSGDFKTILCYKEGFINVNGFNGEIKCHNPTSICKNVVPADMENTNPSVRYVINVLLLLITILIIC